MNKERRKAIAEIVAKLNELKADIEGLQEESEAAADALNGAASDIENALSALGEI